MFALLYAFWIPSLVICSISFPNDTGFHEGDQCTTQNEKMQGTCTSISNCTWALTRITQDKLVDTCEYISENRIVCCPLDTKLVSGQRLNDTLDQFNVSHNTASAWSEIKCQEYYPEVFRIVGVGGERSLAEEFPHMAILGYGNDTKKEWRCGGSLISYQHILTAAHCLESTDLELKYVRVGDLDIENDTDLAEPQDFNVKKAIPHPDFDHSILKHDIAILVLDKPVRVTDYVKPGCLFPGGVIEDNRYITASGWGITKFAGEPSSHLIKLKLKIVNNTDCRQQYQRVGSRGNIDEEMQVCAGSAVAEKIIDTCEGDSGGPLQFTDYLRSKHYMIFGVTSFGKACGITRSAGVYTRVSSYLPWIQSIVINNS